MNAHGDSAAITPEYVRETAGLQPQTDLEAAWYREGYADCLRWTLRALTLDAFDEARVEEILDGR